MLAYNSHIFLAFCTWAESHGDGRYGGGGYSSHGRQKGEREGVGTKYITFQHTTPSNLHPLTRPHILKFPEPPRKMPTHGDQACIHRSL